MPLLVMLNLLTPNKFGCQKLSRCLAAAFFLLASPFIYAHEINFSAGAEHWHYREFDFADVELDAEKDWLAQVQGQLLLDVFDTQKIHARYRYRWGDIRYIGQTQAGVPLRTRSYADTGLAEISWRYYFPYGFLGLGANQQSWDRRIQKTESTEKLYEYYRWYGALLELGFLAQVRGFSLSLIGSYSPNQGYMEADFTKLKFSNGAVRNYGKPRMHFYRGYEAQVRAQIKKPINDTWHWLFEPYIGKRHFPEGETVSVLNLSFYEPKSDNFFYGATLGLGLRF